MSKSFLISLGFLITRFPARVFSVVAKLLRLPYNYFFYVLIVSPKSQNTED